MSSPLRYSPPLPYGSVKKILGDTPAWRAIRICSHLIDHLERELDDARHAGGTVSAEVRVHLVARGIEARAGVEPGELRVVPGVEHLGAELDEAGFGEQRHTLADRYIPVVRARPTQD